METLTLTFHDPFDSAQDMFTIDFLILSYSSSRPIRLRSGQALRGKGKERRVMEIFLENV